MTENSAGKGNIICAVPVFALRIHTDGNRRLEKRKILSNGEKTMRIEHVAMYVNDLEKTSDFFVKYFHAVSGEKYYNRTTEFQSYFLTFGDGARLEIMNRPDVADEEKSLTRTGYIHLAFSLGSKGAVDALTDKLKNDGYPVVSGPRTTGDGYYESCIVGPEGNLIEITE